MNKLKHIIGIGIIATAGFLLVSADHIDAPAVTGGNSDITDFYAFQGEDNNNLVFVANVQGLLSPAATASASFDENVMVEFNIDTNNDNVEDLVIQAVARDGQMHFFGPTRPSQTGLNSVVETSAVSGGVVDITPYGTEAIIEDNDGMTFFAGPRDDPFFMDFARYGQIIGGMAPGFNNPGNDTFAGTNVMSIVVEVPKSLIGETGTINTWVESKRK